MSRLDSQIAAVQRKLTLGLFIDWLAVSGLVLAALLLLTVLVEKATHVAIPAKALWVAVGLTVVAALIVAIQHRPTEKAAAVAIDERLALKEKFSTALSVRHMKDPFAQAVVLDAELTAERVQPLGHFRLRFPRTGYATLSVGGLALLALLLPQMDLLGREERRKAQLVQEQQIAMTKETIRQTIAKVESLPLGLRNSEEIRLGKFELEKMLNHPMPDESVVKRRQLELLGKMDEALRNQAEAAKAYAQAQRNQAMFRSMSPPADEKGPVADAQRALAKGDFKEAVEKLKDAAQKFDQMSQPEKQAAMQQMQALAQQMAQMAQDKQAEQKMAQALQQMGATQEQIKKAQELVQQAAQGNKQAQQQLQQLQQQMAQQMNKGQGATQQQMQQLQKAMQQAQQAANAQSQAGQMSQAAQAMAQAMQRMQAGGAQSGGQQMAGAQQMMQGVMDQLEAMQQDAEAIAAAQKALMDAIAQANGEGEGDFEGEPRIGEWQAGDSKRRGAGQGGPGIGWGGGLGKSPAPFGVKQERSKTFYDPKGEHLASMLVKDRSVKGESKLELQKIAEAAQAEEGDDIDESALDRRSQQVKRNYFRVMADEAKGK
ncbi:MAG: hypothetical protein ACM359_21860 [Bacillota bacterium]